jgi:hypothetical protein
MRLERSVKILHVFFADLEVRASDRPIGNAARVAHLPKGPPPIPKKTTPPLARVF